MVSEASLHSDDATSAPRSVVRPKSRGVGPWKQTTDIGVGGGGNTRRAGRNQHVTDERLQFP